MSLAAILVDGWFGVLQGNARSNERHSQAKIPPWPRILSLVIGAADAGVQNPPTGIGRCDG